MSFRPDPQFLFPCFRHSTLSTLSVLFPRPSPPSPTPRTFSDFPTPRSRATHARSTSPAPTDSPSCTLALTRLPACPWGFDDTAGRATMPVSIEELDATVRAFYEGRGEQVINRRPDSHIALRTAMLTTDLSETAKSCPSRPQPGTSPDPPPSRTTPRSQLTVCCSSRKTPMPG